MYQLKKIEWKACKEICDTLYESNLFLTPYQEYDFMDTVGLGFRETKPFSTFGYKKNTYVFYSNSKPIAVLPIYVNRIKREIRLFGELSIASHLDFVYDKRITVEDYKALFYELRKLYKGYILNLDRISEKSKTYLYLESIGVIPECEKSICVSIPFDTYDGWFQSLSKSFRQDIRSGYNRLKTDNKQYNFCFDSYQEPTSQEKNEMLKLYAKRACEHSKISPLVAGKVLYIIKKHNAFNNALYKSQSYIGGRLYIDGSLVAYFQGVVSNDGRLIVPKLSIDISYKRYNLGGLLINETIQHLFNQIDNSVVNQFDLARGDERYKYDYGGKPHYNYGIKMQL